MGSANVLMAFILFLALNIKTWVPVWFFSYIPSGSWHSCYCAQSHHFLHHWLKAQVHLLLLCVTRRLPTLLEKSIHVVYSHMQENIMLCFTANTWKLQIVYKIEFLPWRHSYLFWMLSNPNSILMSSDIILTVLIYPFSWWSAPHNLRSSIQKRWFILVHWSSW